MKKQQFTCMALLCAMFWAGCSNVHKEVSSADTTAVITSLDTGFKAAKLVKTADMNFKVKNVKVVSEEISALTQKYKGMVMHHAMRSTVNRSENLPQQGDSVTLVSSYSTSADLIVKIPSGEVDEFMNQVDRMAVYVNSRNMDIQDKTLDYLSAQMKVLSRNEFIAQQKKGIIKVKNPADVMNLKDDMIDQQINNKRIDNDARYSTIGLNFYQNNTPMREVIVNDDPSAFKLPFFTRLNYAFINGWVVFTDMIIGIAHLWMPILILVAVWITYRFYKRKSTVAIE